MDVRKIPAEERMVVFFKLRPRKAFTAVEEGLLHLVRLKFSENSQLHFL